MADIQVFKVHLKRNRQINHFYLHILLILKQTLRDIPPKPYTLFFLWLRCRWDNLPLDDSPVEEERKKGGRREEEEEEEEEVRRRRETGEKEEEEEEETGERRRKKRV